MEEHIHENPNDATVKWVSTEWLNQHIKSDSLTIIDTQPNIHDYISEHVPGSVYFNPELLRVPKNGLPGVYVPQVAAEQLFRRIGILPHQPIVVYTGKGIFKKWGDGLEQTMIAYSIARFGHKNIMILDGGLDKWKAEEKKLTKTFPMKQESTFNTEIQQDYIVAMDDVKALKENDDVLLLDARPSSLYEGFGPWVLPGHIPGAINLPWRELMDDKNPTLLKSDNDIQKILNQKNITSDKLIICSCGTGREATNEFLLFKWYLGYPRVKIYEGSFTDWVSHPENHTVTGKKPLLGQKEIVE